MNGNGTGSAPHFEPIAIIGMRGRFPGASDLETYWHNLANGVESIDVLSQDDIRAAETQHDAALARQLAPPRLRQRLARARQRRRVRRRVLRLLRP